MLGLNTTLARLGVPPPRGGRPEANLGPWPARLQTQPLPLPSEGASAEGAAPATEASGHAEALLAKLPHMNLF